MKRNLFAICLVVSLSIHLGLAAFLMGYRPAGNVPSVIPVNLSVVSLRELSIGTKMPSKNSAESGKGFQAIKKIDADTGFGQQPAIQHKESPGSGLSKAESTQSSKSQDNPTDTGTVGNNPANGSGGGAEDGISSAGDEGSGLLASGGGASSVTSIVKARPLGSIDVRYDETSRRRGEQGTVSASVKIDVNGNPVKVRIIDSSGYPRLDRAALIAIRSVKFSPTTRNGKPVESEVEYRFVFRLDESQKGSRIIQDEKVNILE